MYVKDIQPRPVKWPERFHYRVIASVDKLGVVRKLYAAPGIEDGHHGTEELLRLGVEYAFEMGEGWEVAPQVNVDLVDSEDVWVFGLVFARGF